MTESRSFESILLVLVTGFLGAGKTTLLKRLADRKGRSISCLVNEYGDIDVDGGILSESGSDVLSRPGGSLFCRCLLDEFVGKLREIADLILQSELEFRPQQLVVETSGIADPGVLSKLLEEFELNKIYHISGLVAVVDASALARQCDSLPPVRAQIRAAGLVLLNKTDLCSVEQLSESEGKVKQINPNATIIRCTRCRVDADTILSAESGLLKGEYAECADPKFSKAHLRPKGKARIDNLRMVLSGFAPYLLRAKGAVQTTGGRVMVDISPSGIELREAGAGGEEGIVLLYETENKEQVRKLRDELLQLFQESS